MAMKLAVPTAIRMPTMTMVSIRAEPRREWMCGFIRYMGCLAAFITKESGCGSGGAGPDFGPVEGVAELGHEGDGDLHALLAAIGEIEAEVLHVGGQGNLGAVIVAID